VSHRFLMSVVDRLGNCFWRMIFQLRPWMRTAASRRISSSPSQSLWLMVGSRKSYHRLAHSTAEIQQLARYWERLQRPDLRSAWRVRTTSATRVQLQSKAVSIHFIAPCARGEEPRPTYHVSCFSTPPRSLSSSSLLQGPLLTSRPTLFHLFRQSLLVLPSSLEAIRFHCLTAPLFFTEEETQSV
jgi:hypothetical protein